MITSLLAIAALFGGHFVSPLPASELASYVDKLDAAWIAEAGTSASGLGLGDGTYGASAKQAGLATLVAGSGNIVSQSVLAPIAQAYPNNTAALAYASQFRSFFSGLNNLANQTGVATSLNGLLEYYDSGAGGPWACMAPPEWVQIYQAVTGSAPDPLTVYAPVPQGSTYTVGLGEYNKSTSTFTAATGPVGVLNSSGAIDTTKYAGGFAQIQWTSGSGSGTCTVTVAGLNQAGVAENYVLTGTWGSGPFTATQTGVLLVPATTSTDLITKVTGYTVTGMTAGVFYVSAVPPSGRTYPPS